MTARLGVAGLVLLAACQSAPEAESPERASAPPVAALPPEAMPAALADRLGAAGLSARVLDAEADAYALVEVDLDGEPVLLQWADLRRVDLGQVLGPEAGPGDAEAAYHPTAPSPAFGALHADSVVARLGVDPGLLAVVNGAFYEELGASTRLAFPAAVGGAVVSGGSSPAGPGRPEAAGRRWDRPLRVLALGDTLARIADLDHETGEPLGAGAFAEAVASYAPEAHPTRDVRRFHLAGALDADGDGTAETLLILTATTTLDHLGDVLDRLGVAPDDRIAPDGGASVFVWNRRTDALHRAVDDRPLPHHLVLRLR